MKMGIHCYIVLSDLTSPSTPSPAEDVGLLLFYSSSLHGLWVSLRARDTLPWCHPRVCHARCPVVAYLGRRMMVMGMFL